MKLLVSHAIETKRKDGTRLLILYLLCQIFFFQKTSVPSHIGDHKGLNALVTDQDLK